MSPNQYVSDLRAERDALRAVVARVEEIVGRLDREAGISSFPLRFGYQDSARLLRVALSGDLPFRSERTSTDSDPAATERQGEAEGAGDGV